MTPRHSLLSLLVLAGCFGSGAPPGPAGQATAVFSVPQNTTSHEQCNGMAKYIGDVAIAQGSGGYAVELPWEGPGCDSSGGMFPQITVDVLQFDGAGTTPAGTSVGSAGSTSGTTHPRVAADGATGAVAWAFSNQGGMGGPGGPDIDVGVVQPNLPTIAPTGIGLTQPTGNVDVAGMTIDAAATWLAVTESNMTQPDVDLPTFPCCNNPAIGSIGQGSLWRVGFATGALTVTEVGTAMAFPAGLPTPIVSNTDTVFYVVRPMSGIAELGAIPKTGTSDADRIHLASLDTTISPSPMPVGLAADDQHFVWAVSVDAGVSPDAHGCAIFALDLAMPLGTAQPQTLFTSTAFSCMGLAVDATDVYFTIVGIDHDSNAMLGEGLGRVALADGTFESIALHMVGAYAGPRRIILDNVDDAIYAIDPVVVGKLPKTALAGGHDF